MAPRRPALPPAAFTKGEVNRAGELMLALRERMQRDGPARGVAEFDEEELERAWEALR